MTLNLRPPSPYQHQDELVNFVTFCKERGVRRYLEIGSRWGDSFFAVMANLPVPSFGVFIDLPESAEKSHRLMETAVELINMGHDIRPFLGDSRDREQLKQTKILAPFDLILIDANHTYEGVRADWTDYHWMAPIVALHDVSAPETWMSDGKPNGVGRFWNELKRGADRPGQFYGFKDMIEFIVPSDRPMGYGIVVR